MTNLTNEEMLAHELAAIVREHTALLRRDIERLKIETAELRGELRVTKELALRNSPRVESVAADDKHVPAFAFPGEASPRRAGH